MGTKNVGAIEERHNSVGLDVDLVAGVGSNEVQARKVKAEFASLLRC
jgi:glycerol-3-phosphate responsive antiterminator